MKDTYEKPLCVICVAGRDIETDVVVTSGYGDPNDYNDPFDSDY